MGISDALKKKVDQVCSRLDDPELQKRADYNERQAKQRERDSRCKAAIAQLSRDVGKRYRECRLGSYILYDNGAKVQTASMKEQRHVVYQITESLNQLPAMVADGRGVILYGPVGSGKDHLAIGMMYYLAEQGISCRWYGGEKFYQTMADVWREDHGTQREAMAPLISPTVLCLSDPVLPYGMSDSNYRSLYRLIDARYCDCKSTWVTMNVTTREEAEKRLSQQVFSRLLDGAVRYFCNWPDYRVRDRD